MKMGGRGMPLTVWMILLVGLGLMAYVRLAPLDPARWHVDVAAAFPQAGAEITVMTGGAVMVLPGDAAVLAALDRVAMATPRTVRVAGSVAEGRITWVTRSRLWGFPDYTTAQVGPQGVVVYARLRFGNGDMGVNAARLTAWRDAVAALPQS